MGSYSNGRSSPRLRPKQLPSTGDIVPGIVPASDSVAFEFAALADESWVPVLIPARVLSHVGQFLCVALTGTVPEVLGTVPREADEPLEKRCRALAESHSLSARESEVLGHISRGRNAQYLEKRLGISLSTAKTHISHVYRKLGVGSQQQLLDLIEQEPGPISTVHVPSMISAVPAVEAG